MEIHAFSNYLEITCKSKKLIVNKIHFYYFFFFYSIFLIINFPPTFAYIAKTILNRFYHPFGHGDPSIIFYCQVRSNNESILRTTFAQHMMLQPHIFAKAQRRCKLIGGRNKFVKELEILLELKTPVQI